MNLTHKCSPCKQETVRYKPSHEEGLYIQFILKTKKQTYVRIAKSLGIAPQSVAGIVFGLRRSARIESEIARILGKASWNDVVLEARSEVQKKPVAVIVRETEQKIQAARKAAGRRMADYAAANRERADKLIRDGLAAKRRGA